MNFELTNPFAQNFPERVDTSLDACAQCVRFNNSTTSRFAGNFVAIGRNDGGVTVLDLETKGYLRFLEGHVKAITTVCWSRNSRYLLSASRDWNVIIWDLATGDRRDSIRFDAPVTSASFHPRNSKIVLVTLQNQASAVLVDLRRNEFGGRWDLNWSALEGDEDGHADAGKSRGSKKKKETATFAQFNPRGDLIYVGSSQGNLYVFDSQTKMLVYWEAVSPASSIRSLAFDRAGTSLVTNSNDRCIRVFTINELAFYDFAVSPDSEEGEGAAQHLELLTLDHRFQDLVNRPPWNAVTFSNDGEYVVGGAGHKAAHQIYVWDRSNGSLTKILEGPKDPLDDLDWHPSRPIIASASDQGNLHIWVTNVVERWSAYAPGFEELEENLEYQEHEDEFDVEDEAEVERRKLDKQDVAVDICNVPTGTVAASVILHTSRPDILDYLESSDAWADDDSDDDNDERFVPSMDTEIDEFELEEGNSP